MQEIKKELKDLKGIYGLVCKVYHKIYIGSSENLVNRFKEHIKGKKSNIRLQKSIKLYGLSNFFYIVFESYMINHGISLIDLETKYISYFKPISLYNFKSTAISMLGYKHTFEARQKMINRFKNSAHPMLGKNHS
jgi:group I intron endonuclease